MIVRGCEEISFAESPKRWRVAQLRHGLEDHRLALCTRICGLAMNAGSLPDDTQNLVQLVKQMRAALGTSYGISLTLALGYWYLRYSDAKAMESSIDFF
jgi:hypothetical protein